MAQALGSHWVIARELSSDSFTYILLLLYITLVVICMQIANC